MIDKRHRGVKGRLRPRVPAIRLCRRSRMLLARVSKNPRRQSAGWYGPSKPLLLRVSSKG